MRKTMQRIGWIAAVSLLVACGERSPAVYVGVMVDNHQLARPYQRGLDDAAWVQEQFVEGMITRFEAVYDADNFPVSVGPVRSVRSYYLDGGDPVVAAVFHAGGSPDALERLTVPDAVPSFNAPRHDRYFSYDDVAPAPHHRFLTRDNFRALFAQVESPRVSAFPFLVGSRFDPDEVATSITIDYRSKIHNVLYEYDASERTYARMNRGAVQASNAANIIILETDVAVVGPLGRLGIDMEGSGRALLFRDGGVAQGEWSKHDGEFFAFKNQKGDAFAFRRGQVWVIVLDSFDRLSW